MNVVSQAETLGGTLAASAGRMLDHLKAGLGLSANTVQAYARDLAQFILYLDGLGVTEPGGIKKSHVEDFLTKAAGEGKKTSTRARLLSSARRWLDFLAEEKIIAASPAVDVDSPKLARPLPKALTAAQMRALVGAPDAGTPAGLRDRAMMELMYACGLRVSEMVTIKIREVHLDERFVRVRGKGGRDRVVPASLSAVELLRKWLPVRETLRGPASSDFLFVGDDGAPLSRFAFYNSVGRAARLAGLPPVSPHVIRHSFATHLVRGGADLMAVSAMMGHSSADTTEQYLKVDDGRLREVFRRCHPRAEE
ncbi:MAG: tyrosine recombinase [Deltaproteobacteria bacterium]|jgi:integrase/recombinase XerD|nr:tyrosine recombinase [Deltaproteobacteria bacterium]